jgi:hypothetical protein
VAALFESFLKKASFLFDVRDEGGNPVWHHGLDGLMSRLNLSSADLKNSDEVFWKSQNVESGIFRLAYQLRHKGAHEAHDYAYYERERNAYFVFAALLLACNLLIHHRPDIAQPVAYQSNVETMRDLFVKIDELIEGPDGPRYVGEPSGLPIFGEATVSRTDLRHRRQRRHSAHSPECPETLARSQYSDRVQPRRKSQPVRSKADCNERNLLPIAVMLKALIGKR